MGPANGLSKKRPGRPQVRSADLLECEACLDLTLLAAACVSLARSNRAAERLLLWVKSRY
jgi:hypothetical protein